MYGIIVHRSIPLTPSSTDIRDAIEKNPSILPLHSPLRADLKGEKCAIMETLGMYWHSVSTILSRDLPTFVVHPDFILYYPLSKLMARSLTPLHRNGESIGISIWDTIWMFHERREYLSPSSPGPGNKTRKPTQMIHR